MRYSIWLGPLVVLAACVGDEPGTSESLVPPADLDGGSSSSGEVRSPIGEDETTPALTLTVADTTLTRGQTGAVTVRVVQRVGTHVPVQLQLQGGPPEISYGGAFSLGADEVEASLPLTAGQLAPYGESLLQLTASAPELAAPVVVSVKVIVRGVPGSVDTSFGLNGTAEAPASLDLADVEMSDNGEFIAESKYAQLVHYDSNGVLDTSFGAGGTLEVPLVQACTMSRSMGLTRASGAWIVSGICEAEPRAKAVHARIPFSAPYDVTFEPSIPSDIVGNGLSAGALARDLLHRDGGGFVWAWGWDPQYNIRATVHLLEMDGGTASGWPVGGTPIEPTADIQLKNDVLDLEATTSRIFVLRTHQTQLSAGPRNEVLTIDVANGGKVFSVDVGGTTVRSLSRPGADGSVLVAQSSNRPCVMHIGPDTVAQWPAGCQIATVADDRDAYAAYLRDGRVIVVSLGAVSTYWTLDAAGKAESPLDGTPITFEDGRRLNVVRVFEDAQRRLVIAAKRGPESNVDQWVIKRFWL